MPPPQTFVGIGEALFDIFPDRRILGGAPLNFAVHAHQLATRLGSRGVAVSRTGSDALGREMRDQLTAFGIDARYLQTDQKRPTGQVIVKLDAQRQPSYEIAEHVAWDSIEYDSLSMELAATCAGVCFGTLGQRSACSRKSIDHFVSDAKPAGRMFDINIRQHFYSIDVIRRGFQLAAIVKLNHEEQELVCGLFGIARDDLFRWLFGEFPLQYVLLTRSALGSVLFTPQARFEEPPVHFPPDPNADSVGAGDACAAAVLVALGAGWDPPSVLHAANVMGAFVASRPGGTPVIPLSIEFAPLTETLMPPAG